MDYAYWIDKQGGSHYHLEVCAMVKDSRFNYEPVFRKTNRKNDVSWGATRIREDGKYYAPCPACFSKIKGFRR